MHTPPRTSHASPVPERMPATGAHQQDQHTALHQAAVNGNAAAVHALLAAGAAVDAADAEGRTPLLLAASRGHAGVVRVLLAAGAKLEAAALLQAACVAALHGGLDTVDCLLQHLGSSSSKVPPALPAAALVQAAMAAAEVTGSTAGADQQAVVRRLLHAAGVQDAAGTRVALQQHFPDDRAAGALVSCVALDAMLDASAAVADLDAQKTAVQQLFLSVMAPHAAGTTGQQEQQNEVLGAAVAEEQAPAGAGP